MSFRNARPRRTDGLFCNGAEGCSGGLCVAGTPPVCADSIACTIDICDEATATCLHPTDDSLCNALEQCDAVLGCSPDPALYGRFSSNPGLSCLDILTVDSLAPDGDYWIDPDGPGPLVPLVVYCDMTTAGGGWTVFSHDQEVPYTVTGFEPPGSYVTVLTYTAPTAVINSLMASATEAQQYLYKDCLGSGIWPGAGAYAWWESLAGVTVNSYWPNGSANCDINDGIWRADGGDITVIADLPIGVVLVGDTGDPGESAIITIGKLFVR